MTFWRNAAFVVLTCAIALALAAAARYGLVEPADVTARCDGGAQDVWCRLRSWTIQSFVHQRIGWAALALALVATLGAWRSVAVVALVAACASLVLYTTELGAPAALLAVLVFVRQRAGVGNPHVPANTNSTAQYDSA